MRCGNGGSTPPTGSRTRDPGNRKPGHAAGLHVSLAYSLGERDVVVGLTPFVGDVEVAEFAGAGVGGSFLVSSPDPHRCRSSYGR